MKQYDVISLKNDISGNNLTKGMKGIIAIDKTHHIIPLSKITLK